MEHEPVRLGEVDGGAQVPKKRVQKRKRGTKRKPPTQAQLVRQTMSPRMVDLVEGRLNIDDLDDEEIMRGQIRDVNGGFSGQKPAVIPRQFNDAMARRVADITTKKLREKYNQVLDRHVDIAINGPAKEAVAAQIHIMERLVGKVPDKMEIKQEVSVFERAIETDAFLVDFEDDIEDAVLEDEDEAAE